MTTRHIAVSRLDQHRILATLRQHQTVDVEYERDHLKQLRSRLESATVVDSREMLPDIVTMNSTFKLFDTVRSESDTFTLVYPDEACIAEGKLSILSPLGAEVFGRRVGESLTLQVLNGETQKRVDQLFFQPERMGAFSL